MMENFGISGGVDNYPGLEGMTAEQQAAFNRKRERTNAKAVECLDLDGNLIEVYRSGMLASQALNIQQGDISLCCRGLKHSVGGFRFRFFGESDLLENITKIKKGFVIEGYIEGANRTEVTRSTRASRGDYQQQVKVLVEKQSILAPPEIQSRTWTKNKVSVGPFSIMKWVPSQPQPTAALQELMPKAGDGKKKLKLTKGGKKSLTGVSGTGFVNRAVTYRDSEYTYEEAD